MEGASVSGAAGVKVRQLSQTEKENSQGAKNNTSQTKAGEQNNDKEAELCNHTHQEAHMGSQGAPQTREEAGVAARQDINHQQQRNNIAN